MQSTSPQVDVGSQNSADVMMQICDKFTESGASVAVSRKPPHPRPKLGEVLTTNVFADPMFMALFGRPIYFGFLLNMTSEHNDTPVGTLVEMLQKNCLGALTVHYPVSSLGRNRWTKSR